MADKPKPIDEKRAQFALYKSNVKKTGKPFYPYAMFHDTVMSLVVVSVSVGLARVARSLVRPGRGRDAEPHDEVEVQRDQPDQRARDEQHVQRVEPRERVRPDLGASA